MVPLGNSGVSSVGGGGGGSNQWMNFPSMNAPGFPVPSGSIGPDFLSMLDTGGSGGGGFGGAPSAVPGPDPGFMSSTFSSPGTPPGIVPPAGVSAGAPLDTPWNKPVGGSYNIGGGKITGPTLDPNFTQQLYSWLRGQMGQGASPFNLSAILPSTGGTTSPGTLTAPENPILQSLQKFFQTGEGGPLPGVLPMWTSAMKSMEIPIEKQLANIKEQFGARGALGSSEMASALESFGAQTAADQESLLGQMTLQALPGMEQFGSNLQQMDQGSIDRLVQEFIRTRPEYSPLLSEEFSAATTFPPLAGKNTFGSAFMGSLGSALGGSLGSFGISNKGGTFGIGG